MGLFSFKKKQDSMDKHLAESQVGPTPSAPPSQAPLPPQPPVWSPETSTQSISDTMAMPPVSGEPIQAPADVPNESSVFALPELPPMPDEYGAVHSDIPLGAQPIAPEHVEGELPELPDLPTFDNHPEEMHDFPEDAHGDDMEMDDLPESAEPVVAAPEPKKEYALPTIDNSSLMAEVGDEPLFLDVAKYQDVLQDLSLTKADLNHIHDRSKIAEFESKIDAQLESFRKNILQAKTKLTHVDETLFAR